MLWLYRRHVVVLLLLVCATIVFLSTLVDYTSYLENREKSSLEIGNKVMNHISADINDILDQITAKAAHLADTIYENDFSEDDLLQLLKSESHSLSAILGITAAFEPFVYGSETRLYAPYFDKVKDDFIYIEDVYDYTQKNLQTAQWYVKVANGGAQWIEPYYAEGAQTMVADYGVPFYYDNPETGKKEIGGTITMTISLSEFTRLLNALSLGKTGYGFVVSPEGNFIAHPIAEYVRSKNVLALAEQKPDDVLARFKRLMLNVTDGFERYENEIIHQTSYLFYSQIPSANWSMGLVFIQNELLGNPVAIREKLMHVGFSFSFVLLFLLSYVLRVDKGEERHMWRLAMVGSFLLVANISYIWYLTLNYTFPDEKEERYKIVNITTLNRFINLENHKASQLRIAEPMTIPTGVFVRELEFADSYNVNISLEVWQKYDHSISDKVDQAILFDQTSPFAEALVVDKSTTAYADHDIVTWEIRGTYRLDFNYSTYPFDYRQLDLQLSHPDRAKNILLTPYLESYKVVNQSAKPGTNPQIVLPESEVTASFFDYTFETFNENFGYENLSNEHVPQLHFNLTLKRHFINAFVSNIIPILIVAMMVYFLVYSSTKKEKEKSDVSSLGIVESSAAFFFVLLLAHIDLRKSVITPVITYMESFYFVMYVLLALVAFNIVMFTSRENFWFFDYRDNLIVKLTYWPIFLGMCFLITIIRFY